MPNLVCAKIKSINRTKYESQPMNSLIESKQKYLYKKNRIKLDKSFKYVALKKFPHECKFVFSYR